MIVYYLFGYVYIYIYVCVCVCVIVIVQLSGIYGSKPNESDCDSLRTRLFMLP